MSVPWMGVVVVVGGVLSAGALSLLEGRADQRLLRELQRGATRPIDSLQHRELARVVGLVEPSERLVTAPLSGRKGVAWEISVWRAVSHRTWEKVATAADHVPFALRDAGGRALVRVSRVRSYGVVDHEYRLAPGSACALAAKGRFAPELPEASTPNDHDDRPSPEAMPEQVRAFLSEHHIEAQKYPLHLKESLLEVGERAVVVGHVVKNEDDGSRATYRNAAHLPEVTITAPAGASVLFSDAPEAIDPHVVERAPD